MSEVFSVSKGEQKRGSIRKKLFNQTYCSKRDFKSRNELRYKTSIVSRMDLFFDFIKKIRFSLNLKNRSKISPQNDNTPQPLSRKFYSEYPSPPLDSSPVVVHGRRSEDVEYGSPPPSPCSQSAESPNESTPNPFEKRKLNFLHSHSPLYSQSLETRREKKIQNFLLECKATRNQIFNIRRGFWVCGLGNSCLNLGNELHIAERHDKRLDRDKDQTVPIFKNSVFWLDSKSKSNDIPTLSPCQILTLKKNALFQQKEQEKFQEANLIVRETFKVRGIDADLSFVVDNGFTVDLCVLNNFTNDVLGCVLYVFMKKYLWVEEIAVKEEWRGKGVGTALLNRMKNVAKVKEKEILLYALESAVPFYLAQGFVKSNNWPVEHKSFPGFYLTWSPQSP